MAAGDATTERLKGQHGGWRPGAGRPRKPRREPARPLPAVGSVVLLWRDAGRGLVPLPALIVSVDRADDAESPLYLIPFDFAGAAPGVSAPFTAGPRAECWSWPAKARTTYDVEPSAPRA